MSNISEVKIKFLFIFSLLVSAVSMGQNLDDLDFGTEETFDFVTWNIEFFPKNDDATIQYVAQIIEAMDADVIAVQEVDDYFAFNTLLSYLGDYSSYYQSFNNRGLAYIYKTDIITINAGYELFTSGSDVYNFPRFPMVLDIDYHSERVVLINNHFKCCGNGELELNDSTDEETRRYFASELLKEYIDDNFVDIPVILTGDLNDVLIDDPQNNVFQSYLDDTKNYLFTDLDIAVNQPEQWSYPSWPSHLDHILITKELFPVYNEPLGTTETVLVEDFLVGGWEEYDQNVSDHRPVGIHLPLPIVPVVLGTSEIAAIEDSFFNVPNPFNGNTTFQLPAGGGKMELEIYNSLGALVYRDLVSSEDATYTWSASILPNGIYIAQLTSEVYGSMTTRLLLTK